MFAEKLWVPWVWWLMAGLFAGTLFLAVAFYLGTAAGLVAFGAIAVVVVPVFAAYGSAELLTLPDVFQAGRARLEWRHVGAVRALTAEETRLRRGRDADARAWLLVRPWLSRAVEITVDDADDPAPYWLVGTRRPRALAEALSAYAAGPSSHGVEDGSRPSLG
ncbi:hypothetical protein FHX74_003966 [Friedmanniella endophytica]|uniref:DUF3093 domain-containing protein n=1 Tax=Microlunatus kandeliicorticis TaxID=1759536 RepID=A0A7W3IW11_9ACTN|nr:DUF3093 domain-containing protein [Microlunatus kandeliicorticis]MBA8796313.1 hypothetical protein [Microlunatus kandeliicorticis]